MRQFNRFRGTKGFLSTMEQSGTLSVYDHRSGKEQNEDTGILEEARCGSGRRGIWSENPYTLRLAEEAQGRKREVGSSQSREPYTENKTQTSVGLADTARATASARRTSKPW